MEAFDFVGRTKLPRRPPVARGPQAACSLWYVVNVSLYSCSPYRVSRKLWTVHERVSCMQLLRERYASRTCYNAGASLWRQRQGLNYAQSQPTVSSTTCTGFNFTDLTRWTKSTRSSCSWFYGVSFKMKSYTILCFISFYILFIYFYY